MRYSLAIIVQGTSGAGKTTISRRLATRYQAAYLESDYFVLGMLPYRPISDEHIQLGTQNFWHCLERFVDAKKNIIIDGILTENEHACFSVADILTLLEQAGYHVLRVKLTADYDVAYTRMCERVGWEGHETVVEQEEFEQIADALRAEIPVTVPVIDTDGLTLDQVEEQIIALVQKQ